MEKQESQISENDPLTISRKSIPIDLFISIFSRLPVKSIARSRCVSKQWASILRRREFTDLFLKTSSTRPCLLFTFEANGKWLFFSAHVNPEQSSSVVVAEHHMNFPNENDSCEISRPVSGLLCDLDIYHPFICNPSTGQYVTLPVVTSRGSSVTLPNEPTGSIVSTHFGYDPVGKLFKALRMSDNYYWVLTLGQLSWRKIECSIPHCSLSSRGICISGVVYYLGACNGYQGRLVLVCFNVGLEKFKFLDMDSMIFGSVLINFKGKVGAVLRDNDNHFYRGRSTSLELWVLDDFENQKWSKHIYELPSVWKNLVGYECLNVVGMTSKGEIVLSPPNLRDHFYIFYYNPVKNTLVRIEISLENVVPDGQEIYMFIDHVEDVKLMEMLGSS